MNARPSALLSAALLLASCGGGPPPATGSSKAAVTVGGKSIPVEVWETERDRRSTLYGLPRLEEGRGLLLAWPRARHLKIESESSPATYDLAFLDRAGKVLETATLAKEDPEGVQSRAEAAYALLLPPKTAPLAVGASVSLPATRPHELPAMRIGDVAAHVELALTEADRAHGLMFRPRMSADDGMLFAYADEGDHSFWMKNTLIPLDIAFFKADGTLLNVCETPTAADPRAGPWPTAPSDGPSRFVLEMNLGWFKRKGLVDADGKPKPGTRAVFPPEAVQGRFE
ncbi:MAG TPA: DUF192 domain-containing protein [Planctomycetota bacterium]|nr:DUF192 domain-containing protein [Planctomycetota bacterium]